MTCCKIYLTISALTLITRHVNANYEYERFKTSLSHLLNVPQVPNQYDIYESASSEIQPHYYNSYESSPNRYRDRDFWGSPSERIPISIKKRLFEKKNLKKTKTPFLTINKDYAAKYKELFPDSEIAHCREIKIKSIGKEDDVRKNITSTCYKCEDPKTKSMYKRCLYNDPLEESAFARTQKMKRFSSIPVNSRYRRSNVENDKIDYGKTQNPYRFTDEYFTDATYDVPAAYESKGERCDKIVKNSMVCMICQNAKTNGKYEQCSYVKQPRERAYAYIKSDTFENPRERRNDSAEHPDDRSNPYPESSDLEESNVEKKDWNPTATKETSHEYSYPSEDHTEKVLATNQQDKVQDASLAACKQVQRDSKTCTVCKDPKIGGIYEKCIYNYEPSDKLYKYSRSKSFGYPDKISTDSTRDDLNTTQTSKEKSKRFDYPQSSDSTHDYLDTSKLYPWRSERIVSESQQVANDFDGTSRDSPSYGNDYSNSKTPSNNQPLATDNDDTESYEENQSSTPSSRSVSQHYSENIGTDNCKKFQKDSMTCTICKDPKTGNDFEQCSYSYEPSDKIFSYSKSSSFGNSRGNDKYREDEQSPNSSGEIARDSYNAPEESYEASTTDKVKYVDSKDDARTEGKKEGADKVGYLDTTKKKAEIEEFMQNFRKKDRSKCRKTMRDKMTCYRCVDEEGVQKEECVFVTGREPDQLAFREMKEYQIDPASLHARDLDEHPSSMKTRARAADPLEASASASRNSYVKLEKSDSDYPDETQHTAEETKEAEPYDYTSETRSRYDKVLGLTLPAYMFATSEHEAAFDEIVASSHDQR